MRAGKAVMSARSLQQLLWVALGGACTAETLQPADQPPLPRNFLAAMDRVRSIRAISSSISTR